MQPPPADRFTFTSEDVWLSEFRLAPGDPSWSDISQTTNLAVLIAFPRAAVAIHHEGRSEVMADSMSAVVYSPGQAYRRRLVAAQGDDCTVLAVTREVAAAASTALGGTAPDPATHRFPFAAAAVAHTDLAALQRIRHVLSAAHHSDHDALREELLWLAARVVGSGYGPAHPAHKGMASGRHGTAAEHREITDAVRERLGRSMAHAPLLNELAANVGSSPFHLARVFRQTTGHPIHAYLTQLRLRASLAPIADGVRLADVAQQLGFASHAHLSDRFRRAYGLSPAAWRAGLHSRPLQSSKIMEARGTDASLA